MSEAAESPSQGIVIQPVYLKRSDGHGHSGQVRLQVFDAGGRLRRILRFGATFWGAGLLSLFIPIAHFVLVPFFFLLGIVAMVFASSQRSKVLGGEGRCPHCDAAMTILPAGDSWPLVDMCDACRTQVTIIKGEGPPSEGG